MKRVTGKVLEHAISGVLSRPFIDRSVKKDNAILEEQRKITKEFGGNTTPAYLYNYYVTICHRPTWDLSDDAKVAKQLGLTTRKVADTRRQLTKAGWIYFVVSKHQQFKQAYWFIGKEVVELSKRMLVGETLTDEELLEAGLISTDEYNRLRTQVSDEEQ